MSHKNKGQHDSVERRRCASAVPLVPYARRPGNVAWRIWLASVFVLLASCAGPRLPADVKFKGPLKIVVVGWPPRLEITIEENGEISAEVGDAQTLDALGVAE